jgi:hypothetical protein
VFASEINLNTEFPKDLMLFGPIISVNEPVNKDLTALGSMVTIDNEVGDDLRVIGSNININDNIGGEALILGSNIVLGKDSIINEKLTVFGALVTLNGKVMNDVKVRAEKIIINNEVYGNADFVVEELEFGPKGIIKGELKIPENVDFDKEKVQGTIQLQLEKAKPKINFGSKLFNIIGLFSLGLIFILVFGKLFDKANNILIKKPLFSALIGLVALIALPIIIIILMITVIGIYLALILILLYILMLMFAFIIVPYRIGVFILNFLGSKSKILALIVGLVVIAILGFIPVVKDIVLIATILFGCGSFVLLFFTSSPKKAKKKGRKKRK